MIIKAEFTRVLMRTLTNFGRDIVFSADLCYNGTNGKPRPLGEVAAKPTERAIWSKYH